MSLEATAQTLHVGGTDESPTMKKAQIIENAKALFAELKALSETDRVEAINAIRIALSKQSPFRSEPVDCVIWVQNSEVSANDYNPNSVAPAEMKLLEHSIREDGYTQPIVAWKTDAGYEVIDGFHRNRVGKESKVVRKRVLGYLPLAVINTGRTQKADRMASTIRHNRARGKHRVDSMAEIVVDLRKRNWSDEKIARELGMDADEVLRLCQITGLAEMFRDRDFNQAWQAQAATDSGEVIEE
jgi:ParB-like chromosome segregation protein Spo0J